MANQILTAKAVRAQINIAEITIDVFKTDDGSFHLNQTGAVKAVDKHASSIIEFWRSKASKPLRNKGYTFLKIEAETAASFISSVPIEVAQAYWAKEAFKGNKLAQALIMALMSETLDRKCFEAFNQKPDEIAIAKRAKQAYDYAAFGNLANEEYVDLCIECREDQPPFILN